MNDEKISIKQELKNGASDKPNRLIAYSDSNAKIKSSVQLWMQLFISHIPRRFLKFQNFVTNTMNTIHLNTLIIA